MMTIVPELGVNSVSNSVAFYLEIFGAKLLESVPDDENGLIWAEVDIFGSSLMFEEVNALASEFIGADANKMVRMKGCMVFRITDLGKSKTIYEKAKNGKVSFAMEWKETDYGTAEFGVYDPDGNIVLVSSKQDD